MEAIAATFVLGLGSAASPCLLPLYPGLIGYLAGNDSARRSPLAAGLGLAVLGGVLSAMSLAGVALSLLALPFGDGSGTRSCRRRRPRWSSSRRTKASSHSTSGLPGPMSWRLCSSGTCPDGDRSGPR